MKKINIKITSFVFSFLFSLMSCSDLDLSPMDKLSDDTFWKTSSDLEVFVNSFYETIVYPPHVVNTSVWDNQVPNNRDIDLWGEGIVPSSGGGWSSDDWSDIRSCNYFLARCNNVEGDNSQYIAETRFFRAWFYFKKMKQFGDVPFLSKDLSIDDKDLIFKKRDSRVLVTDSILADLDYAINKLPSKDESVSGRINKDVALALASRVCLFEGTWRKYRGDESGMALLQKCVSYSEQLMNKDYEIWKGTNNPKQNYYQFFIQENLTQNKEVIFAKEYDRDLNLKHNTTRELNDATSGLSRDFATSYLCTDGKSISSSSLFLGSDSLRQEMANRDPRMMQTIDNPDQVYTSADDGSNPVYHALPLQRPITGYMLVKFHSPYNYDYDASNSTIDYPVFRYAEILLNYAEAKAELGQITNSDLDLSINKIRDRVAMPHMTLENVNFEDAIGGDYGYDISNIIREIRRERRVELVAEGFRGDDIKRWKAGKLLENKNVFLGIKVTPEMRARFDEAGGGVGSYTRETTPAPEYLLISYLEAPTFVWNDRLYLDPIPKDQLKLNPEIKQNPGWENF